MTIQELINKLFHITDAQSAPIIITLLVFIVGGLIRSLFNLFKNIGNRREIRRQFYLLIEEMAGSSIIQGENYLQTANGFTTDGLKPLNMGIVDFYQSGVFKDVGYVSNFNSIFVGIENRLFFRLFNRKLKLEAFYACWKAQSSILFWQEKANSDFKFVLDYYNSHNDRRNNGMLQFEKLTYQVFKSLAGNPQADFAKGYLKELMRIKTEWGNLPNSVAPNIAHKYLVKPIIDLSMSNTYEGAQMIRFCLMDVEAEYINLERMMSVYTNQFHKYAENMKRLASEIITALKTIKGF